MRCKNRGKGKTLVLTRRDLNLLQMVGLNRSVSSEQIARELFSSRDRARHRLRALYEAKFINLLIPSSTEPNLVVLTKHGLETIRDLRPDLSGLLYPAGPLSLGGVQHHLGIVDLRLYLQQLARKEGGHLLGFSGGRSALAQELGFRDHRLVPDAVAVYEVQAQCVTLALEVDTGTEGGSVLERKLKGYGPVFAGSTVAETWIIVLGRESRCDMIAEAVVSLGLAERIRIMTHAYINQRPVQKPGARVVGMRRGKAPSESAPSSSDLPSSSQGVSQRHRNLDGRADGRADR